MKMLFWIALLVSFGHVDCTSRRRPSKLLQVPVLTDGMEYRIPVEVGHPAKQFELMIDTGSTLTWLINKEAVCSPPSGAKACKAFGKRLFDCSLSSTCADGYPSGTLTESYGSGDVKVMMRRDKFFVGGSNGMKLNFGEALSVSNAEYFFKGRYDGFLGLGWPKGLHEIDNAESRDQATFITQLSEQHVGGKAVFGINLGSKECRGQITFGGIDEAEFQSKITWAPLHDITDASEAEYWKVLIDGITIGNGQKMEASLPSVMDTGAFAIAFPSNSRIYASFTADIEKRTATTPLPFLKGTGLPPLPLVKCTQVSTLPDLTVYLSGQPFTLGPQEYVYTDRETLDIITPHPGDVPQGYCVVGVIQMQMPAGIDILLGNNFLRAFYSIWDIEQKQFGLAKLPPSSCSVHV